MSLENIIQQITINKNLNQQQKNILINNAKACFFKNLAEDKGFKYKGIPLKNNFKNLILSYNGETFVKFLLEAPITKNSKSLPGIYSIYEETKKLIPEDSHINFKNKFSTDWSYYMSGRENFVSGDNTWIGLVLNDRVSNQTTTSLNDCVSLERCFQIGSSELIAPSNNWSGFIDLKIQYQLIT